MTEPSFEAIAERELAFEPLNGEPSSERVRFRVGRPSEQGSEWYCPFEIHAFGERSTDAAYGSDSVQALLLALGKLRIRLGVLALEHRGRLEFGGRFGPGLPSLFDPEPEDGEEDDALDETELL